MTGRRGTTPGLVAKKRKGGPDRLYWNADSVSRVKAKGFPDRWIPLPDDATNSEIEQLCEAYTERLEAHHAESLNPTPRYLYDGTVAGLCDAYERHPESPIRGVRRTNASPAGEPSTLNTISR